MSLTKYTIVPLLCESVEEMLTHSPGVIANGFRRAGLVPWDPSAPESQNMLPSSIFSKPSTVSVCESIETTEIKDDEPQPGPWNQQDPVVVAGLWPEPLGDGGVGYYHEQEEPNHSCVEDLEEEEKVEVQNEQSVSLSQSSTVEEDRFKPRTCTLNAKFRMSKN